MTAKKEVVGSSGSTNTTIWDALCKTDPGHTKSFSRAGGFKGTAIKPIWTTKMMTELFGPCGIGWGVSKPEYVTQQADKELLVFCTVSLWYKHAGETGEVHGVGGDKVVMVQSSGPRANDEAFKMAYTDAMGNAMKQLGMAADVHMGLFDDSKYVNELRREFADEQDTSKPAPPAPLPEVDDATAIQLTQAIQAAKTQVELDGIWERNKAVLKSLKANRPGDFDTCSSAAKVRKSYFETQQKAV